VKLADCCGNHIEAAPAARYLKQVNGSVEHGCCLFDVALADVSEGQVPENDCLRLVTALKAACGALQDRPCLGAVAEGEIAGALYPSEAVGGEEAVGGVGSLHCLEVRFGGTKGSLTVPAHAEQCVALAGVQKRKAL
jgi:hypothetical protein